MTIFCEIVKEKLRKVMSIDERNGKERIEMTLDYSAAEAEPEKDPGLPKGNAFMQGSRGFLHLDRW